MPVFKPFKALRPHPDYIDQVSARSSDFENQKLLVDALRGNPNTFHHVTKNHLNYSGAFQEPEKFLPFAAKFIVDQKARGVLIKDNENSYYIYHQFRKDGRTFKGIIGLTSVKDYQYDRIKKHEEIRPSRLGFMVELCKTTKVLGEPTLLTYKATRPLNLEQGEMVYDFTSVDGKRHVISKLSEPNAINEIETHLAQIESFYIADGHHRSAAIAEFHSKYPQLDNEYCLSLLMEESELLISSFHRLIRPVVPMSTAFVIEQLQRDFEIIPLTEHYYVPKEKAEFGMFDGKEWFKLKLKHAEHMMDVELLEKYIIRAIFNIQDSRTDGQISFLPNSDGVKKLEELVRSKAFEIAFTLKACEFSEIREISDRHEVLPPKSTFIEPKLRAGMIIQEF